MKKSLSHIPESDHKGSVIHSLEIRYQGSIEALFERIYRSRAEDNEIDHPPIKLRYMVDDYQELLFKGRLN